MVRAIERPMPIPCFFVEKNGSKIFPAASAERPGPVSAIEIAANFRSCAVSTITARSASVVSEAASKAFRIRLEKTCCNWIGSPLTQRGAPVSLLRNTTARDLIVNAAPPEKDILYFAFVNYTTLGYGDIVPV